MDTQEQKPNQQENESLDQELVESDEQKLTRLKREVAEMEKRAAEQKIEEDVEARPEQAAEQEGKISEEVSEGAVMPSSPPLPPPAPASGQSIQFLAFDQQVDKLCELAFQKGVEFAIKTAKDLDNAYILDAFHDKMVDELSKRLVEEKKIMDI